VDIDGIWSGDLLATLSVNIFHFHQWGWFWADSSVFLCCGVVFAVLGGVLRLLFQRQDSN
jgi:hypothetical protein